PFTGFPVSNNSQPLFSISPTLTDIPSYPLVDEIVSMAMSFVVSLWYHATSNPNRLLNIFTSKPASNSPTLSGRRFSFGTFSWRIIPSDLPLYAYDCNP